MESEEQARLEQRAKELRASIVRMIGTAGSGHPGGSLDLAEIVSCLYFHEMRYDFQNPAWPERDYLVLSKGHGAPVLYAALAAGGIIPKEELLTLRKTGSRLQGHPDRKRLPGVEVSTGSLGQGFGVAGGIALSLKLQKKPNRVYAILGDGELDEGTIWEAAMSAAHYQLDNLVAIVDNNGLQIDGPTDRVMSLGDIGAKFAAFGFEVLHTDGHDVGQICDALAQARQIKGKPCAIIAKTVKGKGVSFMENQAGWHGSAPKGEQLEQALAEVEA